MASGESIQQVAADLGYESVPSFVTMFRKALGTSPAQYMAEPHANCALPFMRKEPLHGGTIIDPYATFS
ncbi:MAG: helix-turn-helix domain-containing protein [Sphingobium sp.]